MTLSMRRITSFVTVVVVMAALLALSGGAALADPGNGNGAEVIHTDGGTIKVTTPSCNIMKNNIGDGEPPILVHPDGNCNPDK